MIPNADHEAWLAKRLEQHGALMGLTTVETRREILRAAISRVGPCNVVGRNPKTRKPETYAECFARIYGVPFEVMA